MYPRIPVAASVASKLLTVTPLKVPVSAAARKSLYTSACSRALRLASSAALNDAIFVGSMSHFNMSPILSMRVMTPVK